MSLICGKANKMWPKLKRGNLLVQIIEKYNNILFLGMARSDSQKISLILGLSPCFFISQLLFPLH